MPEKYLPSAVKTEIPDYTSPRRNRFKNAPLDFSNPIFISPGVELKTTGNHIAQFKNIYLRKLTKIKSMEHLPVC